MTAVRIRHVVGGDIEVQRWVRWMDAEVFPDDKPVTFAGSSWFIGWAGRKPACFAAWRPHYPMETVGELHWKKPMGFLYRAGVLPAFRGKGLQLALIEARESNMRKCGIETAVTYTSPTSAASMRSLIACGYRPFETTTETNLSGAGRADGFVHWRKEL